MLTVREAASVLGVSVRQMYNLAAPRGPIPCYQLGPRMTRFSPSDLRAYLDSCKVEPAVTSASPAPPKVHARSPDGGLRAAFSAAGIRPRVPRKKKLAQ
ncbi:helix-turn-helix domain-containing protein [Noviherbaspirillum aridicola]|uniref:Helix-turn-helix domain-containing protein n=1 Tax=Noviherbaspirillum aridicola TaxID=2849687 RepID=A0ABQ4Q9Z8_9BURK|nr:hypothetical protein NCCP691_40590 [Noviherbaspirillum aridicola]